MKLQQYLPFTVLKLTMMKVMTNRPSLLQQYLPFTVLKPNLSILLKNLRHESKLQQYLPFTVLKQESLEKYGWYFKEDDVATVLTVYGIETLLHITYVTYFVHMGCNSTYRLRY